MIFYTIHNPKLYVRGSNIYKYGTLIHILTDIDKRGILIANNYLDYIGKSINDWPANYKKSAIKILKKLKLTNKIHKLESTEKGASDCIDFSYAISSFDEEKIIISPDICCDCIRGTDTDKTISLSNYLSSSFSTNFSDNFIVKSADDVNQISKDKFSPLFKFAKVIKIIDRLMLCPEGKIELKNNYKRGLIFFFSKIKEYNVDKNLEVEIYSSIKLPKEIRFMNPSQKQILRDDLSTLDTDIINLGLSYGLNVTVKFGCGKNSLPHDRYIITNQFGVFLGAGVDIIDENNRFRDFTMGLISNLGDVDIYARSMKEIKDII